MVLALDVNEVLDAPSARILVELWLEASCPLTFPVDLSAGPLLLGTGEVLPGSPLEFGPRENYALGEPRLVFLLRGR